MVSRVACTSPQRAATFGVLKDNAEVSGSLMDALQVTATVVPHLHSALYPKVIDELLPLVFYFVTYPHSGVRTCLAKCLATICKVPNRSLAPPPPRWRAL